MCRNRVTSSYYAALHGKKLEGLFKPDICVDGGYGVVAWWRDVVGTNSKVPDMVQAQSRGFAIGVNRKHGDSTRRIHSFSTSAMLSGILIFNQKGENLIFRAFRNDCRPRLADVFRIQVISNAQVRSPILTLGSTTFSHVKHENIYLVAVTKSNANAALVFEFLYRLVGLGKAYFGKFDEEAVKNNFVLVYELLDEILDFGYPQNTETDTLKMYITTEGVKSERAMVSSFLTHGKM